MELLKYKKNGGLIYIKVWVKNTPSWYYYYQEDQKHENDNAKNKPKEHTIGMPHELGSQTHNWEFRLANSSNMQITCDVIIKWYQSTDNVEKEILKWEKDNVKVKPNDGVIKSGSAILIAEL